MSKSFRQFLLDFPHLSVASEADNKDILEFYHQSEIKTSKNAVIYERGNDFFSFLKERSLHYLVFIMRDDEHKIRGMGVASFRQGYIHGELLTVGYLGDLRIAMNRKLSREWRNFYKSLIQLSGEFEETLHCKYYQTAIISTNKYSKINLVETKIPNLYYKELAAYKMINIVGLWSMTVPSLKNIRWATVADREALITFFSNDHKKKLFGYEWRQEFNHRLNKWSDFKISDFLLITDSQDTQKILAASSVWNPIRSKQVIVSHVPPVFKFIEKGSRFVPGLKLRPIPKSMLPIEILYLNQISFSPNLSRTQKSKLFKTMVHFIFKQKFERSFNMLSYCDFDSETISESKSFIAQKMSMALYSVHYRENDNKVQDDLTLTSSDPAPAFEIALV